MGRPKTRRNPEYALWYAAKKRAQKAKMEFNIDVSDVVIPDRCPVLGIMLSVGDGRHTDFSPSLDRRNNELGYIKGNVAVISMRANRLKADAHFEEIECLFRWMARQLESEP